MANDVKTLLKVAKQALSNQHYKVVEEKCQQVLDQDPKNYNAYLLLAAAAQETNTQLAVKYLRTATKCSKDSSQAYVGLLKFGPNEEIPDVARMVLKMAPAKYADVHRKLELCATDANLTSKCISILANEIKNSNDKSRVRSAYETLLQIYMNNTNIDREWLQLFEETFEIFIGDRTIPQHSFKFLKYLKILKKLNKNELLIKKAQEMLSIYPKEYIPLELLCKIYVDHFDEIDSSFDTLYDGTVEKYANELLLLNNQANVAMIAKGFYQWRCENYEAAREHLSKTNSIVNGSTCIKALADVHLKLRAYTLAEYCYNMSNLKNSKFVQCLVEQENPLKWSEALNVIHEIEKSKIDDEEEKQCLLALKTKALLKQRKFDEAKIILKKLPENSEKSISLHAFKLQCEQKYKEAADVLKTNSFNSSDYCLQYGQCLFFEKKNAESLLQVLTATKLEPYNAECFHWLGRLYLLNNDMDRARKCFEKCVFLNPQHEQCVILLSEIYRQLSEWELYAKILQIAAHAIPNTPCKWAELQLGFLHLELNKFDDAIIAFRAVLRMDAKNFPSWEGLADAYMKRGSYSSALKVYQKICELTDDNVYPRLQVANVQTILKLYKDAIKSFDELLIDHSDYVPALKGAADAHLNYAREFYEQRLIGRCKDHIERAIQYLVKAIEFRDNWICLWRLLANCLDFIAKLPQAQAFINIPGAVVNEPEKEWIEIRGEKLFELSSKFYCRAIKLNPKDESFWYELALNYYKRAVIYGMSETKLRYLNLAADAAKYVIKESPGKWKYWNLLGVICATKEIDNLALSQHCYIKALELDRKLATVWSNLGVLYLSQGPRFVRLANMAFTQAQQSQPSYANAWTGQAQVAESYDRFETIDLLKHSISLVYTDESAIRYAYNICSLISDSSVFGTDKRVKYYIEHLHAVSAALDSITWYCNAHEPNISAEALSFLGFLNYYQKNWNVAKMAFEQATEKATNENQRDKMLCNAAYCYLQIDQPLEAVDRFNKVTEATFRSTIGLAYAYYKAKQYENSYTVYESALELLAKNEQEKALILVALASMVYAFQGDADAKTVLYQCLGLPNPPIEALLSSCALGLLHSDFELSILVLKELKKFERNHQWSHHVTFLMSELYLRQNKKHDSLQYLYSQVHLFPDKPLVRKVIANFLLNNFNKEEKNLKAANRMVEGTIAMLRVDSKREMSSTDVAKLLALASKAVHSIDYNAGKKLAQKAFHVNPMCKKAIAARKLFCM